MLLIFSIQPGGSELLLARSLSRKEDDTGLEVDISTTSSSTSCLELFLRMVSLVEEPVLAAPPLLLLSLLIPITNPIPMPTMSAATTEMIKIVIEIMLGAW